MSQTFDPAPQKREDILNAEWLTQALGSVYPGVVIEGFDIVETLVTMATKIRLRLHFKSRHPDVPDTICIKAMITGDAHAFAVSVTRIEALFYRNCAPRIPLRLPRILYTGIGREIALGLIIMSDVVEEGARFLAPLIPYSPEEARDSLDQLARLHAGAWEGSSLHDEPWIPDVLATISETPILPLERLQALLLDPRGEGLPDAMRDAATVQRMLSTYSARRREQPSCLVHGDAHAGNLYKQGDAMAIVDWQLLQRGCWAQDVVYHLATTLEPEQRRNHERELIGHYIDRLAAAGGPLIDAEEAWDNYRAAAIYGYYLWAVTQKVLPEVTHEFVRRLGTAMVDLDTMSLLGEM